MALTQVAISSRKAIRYSLLFIVFLTIGRIIFVAGVGFYNTLFPPPPPVPTVKFGKLTKIPFPEKENKLNLLFSLETPSGEFPVVPDQASVFLMPKASANLLALDLAKDKAKSMGFTSSEIAESDTLYKFENQNYPANLKINIITGNFSISYDLSRDRTPLDTKPPIAEVAVSQFKSVLAGANTLPEDLTGEIKHEFFKLNNGQLVHSIALSEADLTKVNLTRKPYNELPAVYANTDQSNIWAIISGIQNKGQQVIASEYRYYPVDETQASTYPIKSPAVAFKELQDGKYYLASQGTNKESSGVKIRKIYLAYFDPSAESNFYQPVYVFEGDGDFVGYIPAVSSEFYPN